MDLNIILDYLTIPSISECWVLLGLVSNELEGLWVAKLRYFCNLPRVTEDSHELLAMGCPRCEPGSF